MLAFGVLALLLATAAPQAPQEPGGAPLASAVRVAGDTVQPRPRPRSVQVSEWYSRRLTIHRYAAYSVIPVFGAQYLAGRQLWSDGNAAPGWAKTTHRVGATTLAGLFTVNTVTGLWNLWDSRAAPQGRALRYAHALLMLTADAGFTYAGAKLSEEAEGDMDKRRLHRTIALSSMGVTIASGVMMKIWNR